MDFKVGDEVEIIGSIIGMNGCRMKINEILIKSTDSAYSNVTGNLTFITDTKKYENYKIGEAINLYAYKLKKIQKSPLKIKDLLG